MQEGIVAQAGKVPLKYKILMLIAIPVISMAMHFVHFDKDLVSIHVWRQTYTQNTINNFYTEDFNILNPRINERGDGDGIYRLEFPLMQWLTAAIYKIFGPRLIFTRIFMFVIGLFAIWGMYKMLRFLSGNEMLALFGAWAFTFSPTFYYYIINPLPDLLALCLTIWGAAMFFKFVRGSSTVSALLCGILLALGALCKLPFILFFILPGIQFLKIIFSKPFDRKALLQMGVCLAFAILPMIWYAMVIPTWTSNSLSTGFLDKQVALSVYFTYMMQNLVSTLPESLLNYGSLLFFLCGLIIIFVKKLYKHKLFLHLAIAGLLVLAYFFYELNLIGNIHDYYLFPFYPLLFILVAYGAWQLYSLKSRVWKILIVLVLLILPLTAWLRMKDRWDMGSPGFNKDLLTYKEELRNAVPDDALCIAGNDESTCIFFYYINKKGWAFSSDKLRGMNMQQMIDKGASYLYSDSRTFEADTSVAPNLGDLVTEKGSLRVYALKKK
jgi:hypothetical protein